MKYMKSNSLKRPIYDEYTVLSFPQELGIKHHLHRKKLQLALQCIGSEQEDKFGDLDYTWVLRWLDDVGLPQYKDSFSEARIDGRMLHYLTVVCLLTSEFTFLQFTSFAFSRTGIVLVQGVLDRYYKFIVCAQIYSREPGLHRHFVLSMEEVFFVRRQQWGHKAVQEVLDLYYKSLFIDL